MRYNYLKQFSLCFLLLIFFSVKNFAQIYVDMNATGTGNGSSWANAYTNIQTAIDAATVNDQIWVAEGIYEHISISNKDLKIYGGFAGTETLLTDRTTGYETILDGFNKNRVIYTQGLTSASIFDNLIIIYGIADYGGGMYNNFSSPTITNTTFTNNEADYGGGMYNSDSSPTISNTTFTNNKAFNNGAGMLNKNSSSPTIGNTTFTNNEAGNNGAGMLNNNSSPTISNTTFNDNSAGNNCGGILNLSSSPKIINTTFTHNSTVNNGGGMLNGSSSPTIINTTFTHNSAGNNGTGMFNNNSSPTIINTVFFNNQNFLLLYTTINSIDSTLTGSNNASDDIVYLVKQLTY